MKIIKFIIVFTILSTASFATKPDLFLLKKYHKNQDVKGWVMSEKLDGIRGFWNGKNLITRGGKALNPPKYFLKNYPPFAIDGELWTKRGDFENISSIVRSKDSGIRWNKITHNIFEVPNQSGNFTNRMAIFKKYLQKNPSKFIKIIKQTQIKDKQHLDDFLQNIIKLNGEGVVLRDPTKSYKTGRLPSALKFKKYFDTECVITKILKGKGKFSQKMGSVKCQLKNKDIVTIGSGFSDFERDNPPKIGSQITFKYYGKTKKNKYKYPVFLREFY
jgi:DNA ligase-1